MEKSDPLINTNIRLIATNKKLLVLISLILVFFSGVQAANAATLYFFPSSGSYLSGQTVSVGVYVSSLDQAMNAASGVISFPADRLEVVSLSKDGTIMTLWVQQPSFSNDSATISFEGIVLNPGFTGSAGKILGASFKVKKAGSGSLTFSSGSVLANDGKGTNILESLGNAQFSLEVSGLVPTALPATTPTAVGLPAAPKISSPSHPDSDQWFSQNNAKFVWKMPEDAAAVRLLIGKLAKAVPTVIYSPAIDAKEIPDLEDGVWYFHAQLQNAAGWGAVATYKIQIDTDPPEPFEIKFANGQVKEGIFETDEPRPEVLLEHIDSQSGIDGHCAVKIDSGDWFNSNYETGIEKPDQYHAFRLPLQEPGRHTLTVKASDRALNFRVVSREFVVKPLPAPEITEYPEELERGEALVVKGKSLPNLQITLYLQREKEQARSQKAVSDKNGNFTAVYGEKLKSGLYQVWVEGADERGAQTEPSQKLTVKVKRSILLTVGSWLISILVIAIPVAALAFLFWFLLHRFSSWKRRLKRTIKEIDLRQHSDIRSLEGDLNTQIKILEKTKTSRSLTIEEEKLLKLAEKALAKLRRFL